MADAPPIQVSCVAFAPHPCCRPCTCNFLTPDTHPLEVLIDLHDFDSCLFDLVGEILALGNENATLQHNLRNCQCCLRTYMV